MKKVLIRTRNVVGTAGLLAGAAGMVLAGYVFLRSLPDLQRYVKISRM
jgi:hypothetical protein